MLHELHGFTVPEWMLEKMKVLMQSMRTDAGKAVKPHKSKDIQRLQVTEVFSRGHIQCCRCFWAERDEVGAALWSDVRVVIVVVQPPPLPDPPTLGRDPLHARNPPPWGLGPA